MNSIVSRVIFALLAVAGLEAMNYIIWGMHKLHIFGRIPVSGPPLYRRTTTDYAYVVFNKGLAICMMFHLVQYVWAHCPFALSELTLVNFVLAVPALFVVYDAFYYPFHRALHIPALYPYIHKHHHRQVAPFRGEDDGVNTHPIEMLIGEYFHLFAVAIVPCHALAVVVFMGLGGMLASLNHTRLDLPMALAPVYTPRDHDKHHKAPRCNFGQYVMIWDRLFGTYVEWEALAGSPTMAVHDDLSSGARPIRPTIDYLAELCTPQACEAARATAMALRDAPARCMVSGGNGMLGARLVLMLKERGASYVRSIDLALPSPSRRIDGVEYVVGDIANKENMMAACEGVEVVFHSAALVGPYYPEQAYDTVNRIGTQNIIEACKHHNVRRLVLVGSPSTRMDGSHIKGQRESQLAVPKTFLATYAHSKHKAEEAVLAANGTTTQDGSIFLTTCVAPHQIYGADDRLFLPAFLRAARNGLLRVMGTGDNVISFTHVDNIAHALILASARLESVLHSPKVDPTTAPAGRFYVLTDGAPVYFWDALDIAVVKCGMRSLWSQVVVPQRVIEGLGAIMDSLISLTGGRLQPKLNGFAVKMITIHRWFNIDAAVQDIGYAPIRSFSDAWPETAAIIYSKMKS